MMQPIYEIMYVKYTVIYSESVLKLMNIIIYLWFINIHELTWNQALIWLRNRFTDNYSADRFKFWTSKPCRVSVVTTIYLPNFDQQVKISPTSRDNKEPRMTWNYFLEYTSSSRTRTLFWREENIEFVNQALVA